MSAGRKLSRAQAVALQIEDEILERHMPVGAHLGRRAELMERFGMSPTIMNEVLRILRDRDLVKVRPGTGGGIFVASQPPQVRLGGMDLWFNDTTIQPLDLFEARVHLESALIKIAFERSNEEDVHRMRSAVSRMSQAAQAREYLDAVLHLHRDMVAAARVPVLDEMHQVICALLSSNLSRATFIKGHRTLLAKSIKNHADLVEAIATRDRQAFVAANELHDENLTRATDPHRSPVKPKLAAQQPA